jgi:hypothetical protein
MKQILAIFLKDARRFWPEIAASLAVTAALVMVYPTQWRSGDHMAGAVSYSFRGLLTHGGLGFLPALLVFLVPISWWILIARLVHGERLVGHTQFWLTRPYDWRKFLAAKLLFVAVFVGLPFFAAQMLLLAQAGFNPFAYIPGLLFNLLLVTGGLIVPLMAISAVTSGFGRMTLVLLGLILFVIAVSLLFSLRPGDAIASIPDLISGNLAFLALLLGSAAAVVIQYARRRARTAWLTLAGVAAIFILLAIIDPDQSLISRSYASASGTPPLQLAFTADDFRAPMTNETNDKRELVIAIPLHASEVAGDSAIIPAAMRAVLDGPNGEHWESPWQGTPGDRFLPGSSDFVAHFRIRRGVYERFKSAPVSLRLVYAFDRASLVSYNTIPMPLTTVAVPGVGMCTPEMPWFQHPPEITGIACLSAMRQPDLTYITAHWSVEPCAANHEASASLIGTAWAGTLDASPAQFGIVSVWDVPIYLSNIWTGNPPRPRRICPGSPVTFARFARSGRGQVTLTIPAFHLPELALGDQYRMRIGN